MIPAPCIAKKWNWSPESMNKMVASILDPPEALPQRTLHSPLHCICLIPCNSLLPLQFRVYYTQTPTLWRWWWPPALITLLDFHLLKLVITILRRVISRGVAVTPQLVHGSWLYSWSTFPAWLGSWEFLHILRRIKGKNTHNTHWEREREREEKGIWKEEKRYKIGGEREREIRESNWWCSFSIFNIYIFQCIVDSDLLAVKGNSQWYHPTYTFVREREKRAMYWPTLIYGGGDGLTGKPVMELMMTGCKSQKGGNEPLD